MKTAISLSAKHEENEFPRRSLLFSGILSSLLYVGMNIFIPPLFDGYSSTSQTVSELSAIGAPTRSLWVALGAVYTLLVIFFGWGVWRSGTENRYLRISGILLFAYGVVSTVWPFVPMHQREVIAAGGGTLSDTLHLVLAGTTVALMIASMGFGAAAFNGYFRIYTIATIAVLFVFGLLTGLDAPKLDADLPTPLIGVWERLNVGVFLLWIVVLAVYLLQRERPLSITAELQIKTRNGV